MKAERADLELCCIFLEDFVTMQSKMTEEIAETPHAAEDVAVSAASSQPGLEEGTFTHQALGGQGAAENTGTAQISEPLHETSVDAGSLPLNNARASDDAALQYYATPQQDYPGLNPSTVPAFAEASFNSSTIIVLGSRNMRCVSMGLGTIDKCLR